MHNILLGTEKQILFRIGLIQRKETYEIELRIWKQKQDLEIKKKAWKRRGKKSSSISATQFASIKHSSVEES